MEQTNCNSIKNLMIAYFGTEMQALESREGCVLVLPSKTLDDRFPAVFIDRKAPDYFIVHDAGKTSAELHSQGVHITDAREEAFAQMADRFGAVFANGVFQIGCKQDGLQSAILAISQCESLGMWHILGHRPDLTEEPVISRVERGLRAWNAPYPRTIQARIPVKGKKASHIFDFVSFPAIEQREPLAIKILRPSDDSLAKAREYGFLVYDVEQTYFERWRRIAVVTKADRWTRNARHLVESLSAFTVEVETGQEEKLEELVPAVLDQAA